MSRKVVAMSLTAKILQIVLRGHYMCAIAITTLLHLSKNALRNWGIISISIVLMDTMVDYAAIGSALTKRM